jgi:hypothetical protein
MGALTKMPFARLQMPLLWQRIFRKSATTAEEQTDYQALQGPSGGLADEYQKLISHQLHRWGVPEGCAAVAVREMGRDEHGRDVFVGVVTLFKWDRDAAVRLLLGLPLFEKKIRKALQGLWIADMSSFGGIWLHATGELQADPAVSELRNAVRTLASPRR